MKRRIDLDIGNLVDLVQEISRALESLAGQGCEQFKVTLNISVEGEMKSPREISFQLDDDIVTLGLKVRATNLLRGVGLNTLSDLLERTAEDLLGIRYVGSDTINQIRVKLSERRLRLKDD